MIKSWNGHMASIFLCAWVICLNESMSIVIQIFSSSAVSPSRPQRFASTVAAPPLLIVRRAPLLLVQKVYCCVRQTGSDIVVVIFSGIIIVVITSLTSPPRSAASSKPLPDNRRCVACRGRSWEGDVHEDSILTASWVIIYDKHIIFIGSF